MYSLSPTLSMPAYASLTDPLRNVKTPEAEIAVSMSLHTKQPDYITTLSSNHIDCITETSETSWQV